MSQMKISQQFEKHTVGGVTVPTYSIYLEEIENNRILGTCQELENVFVDGKDEEDVMRRIRIVIEEKLNVMGKPNKNFNLDQLITF